MYNEFLKESEGGRVKICQIMDEIKQKGKEEGIIEGMMKSIHIMITKKGFTLEEALDFFEIPIKEQSIYKQRFIS